MIRKILLPILAILLLAIISISCILQTDHVKKLVENEISLMLERQTGSPIKIEGLHLQFPLIVEAEKVHSEQFDLHHVYIRFSVLNLLRGDVVIRKILAESVDILPRDLRSSSFKLKRNPYFHIDFLSVKKLRFNSESYTIEGEIHSEEDFSISLMVKHGLKDPFYFEINGSEVEGGIMAHLLCRHQEDHIQGLLTLKENETSFKDMNFLFKKIHGEGALFLNAKKEWDGTEVKLKIEDLQAYGTAQGDASIHLALSGSFDAPYYEITSCSQKLFINDIVLQDCLFSMKGQWGHETLKTTLQCQSFLDQNKIEGSCQLEWDYRQEICLNNVQLAAKGFNCCGNCIVDPDSHNVHGAFTGEIPRLQTSFNLVLGTDEHNKQSLKLSCETLDGMFNLQHFHVETVLDWSRPKYALTLCMSCNHGSVQALGFWNFNHIEINQCSGDIGSYPFQLKRPFSLCLSHNSFKTTDVEVDLHEGKISGNVEKNDDIFAIKVQGQKLPLQLLQAIGLPKLEGDADLVLDLSGPLDELTGPIDMKLNRVGILEDIRPSLPLFDAKVKATLFNKNLNYDCEVTGNDLNPIQLSGRLNNESITLHFEAKDEITHFIQLLFMQNAVHMTGEASVVLDLEGAWVDPKIHGKVKWTNGTFEHPETGILYKEISGTLTAAGNTLTLHQLTAVDLAGGTLTGSGSMKLSSEQQHPFTLDLAIKSTQLINLEYATASGDGILNLSGNIQRALLSGTVQADFIKIRIPDEARPHIPTIAVNYINQSNDEYLPTSAERAPPAWPVALDLICEIRKPISIKAKHLRSTWSGNLHIKGDASKPLLYGDFKALSGEYNFRGKIFDIKEGAIFFSGDKSASLYVVGSREIDDIQADVILKGTLKSPTLSFRSNPSMPQREIISYILFGHRSSELTPFQGTELSESITDLNTTYKPDLLSRLTEKIGIDKLDISNNDVKVGKYITKGVLVSFDKSMNSEANHVSIEAKVIKDVKLEGQIGDDAEGQLNIKWKKDY